jgi:hypothetical protein
MEAGTTTVANTTHQPSQAIDAVTSSITVMTTVMAMIDYESTFLASTVA